MTKIAVCLIAKDEGRYLVEWIAYNLVLGFDEILIYDNASTDNTREIIDRARLADSRIRYVPWPDVPKLGPQLRAYNHALCNTDADWIAFIDADEFIVLNEHDTIGEFLSGFDASTGAVCLHWRLFGSSGHKVWHDDLVVRRFVRCARRYNAHVKSIVRRTMAEEMRTHVAVLSSGTYVNANADPVEPRGRIEPIPRRHRASINHYVVKSAEEFRHKVARGQGDKAPESPTRSAKFTPEFWTSHDRNDVEDFAIARFIPALEIEMARLLRAPAPAADVGQSVWHRLKTLFRPPH